MSTILSEVFEDMVFSEKERTLILNSLTKISLKKKEFLLKPNEDIHDLYYIHAGCLRTYFLDLAGKEHTLQFGIKGWWISDFIALFANAKTSSVCYIECLKDATLYKISKKDFDKFCDKSPKLGRLHIKNLELAFASFQNRILENLTLSAKERYMKFVKSYPNIEQNVKNYHVASYLGITTESLSRIRKEIKHT